MKRGVMVGRLLPIVWMAVALSACVGGGEGGTGFKKIVSTGRITDAKATSVTVNGVKFVTSNALVKNDGQVIASPSTELKNGVVITVQGLVATGTQDGSAETISLASTLRGPIDSTGNGQITVLGQTVLIDGKTVIDSPADLAQGDFVAVNGFIQSAGTMLASRVETIDASEDFEVIGLASAIDTATKTFFIGALKIDYGALFAGGFNESILLPDAALKVEGNFPAGTLIASSIRLQSSDYDVEDSENFGYEGVVTKVESGGFTLLTQRVSYNQDVRFSGGRAQDIVPGIHLRVEGELKNSVVLADFIVFTDGFELQAQVAAKTTATLTFTGLLTVPGGPQLEVQTDPATEYEALAGLDDINPGDWLDIKARNLGGGISMATQITLANNTTGAVSLRGRIQSVSSNTINIAGISIDTGALNLSTAPDDESDINFTPTIYNSLANPMFTASTYLEIGELVIVRGTLISDQIQWGELQPVSD